MVEDQSGRVLPYTKNQQPKNTQKTKKPTTKKNPKNTKIVSGPGGEPDSLIRTNHWKKAGVGGLFQEQKKREKSHEGKFPKRKNKHGSRKVWSTII